MRKILSKVDDARLGRAVTGLLEGSIKVFDVRRDERGTRTLPNRFHLDEDHASPKKVNIAVSMSSHQNFCFEGGNPLAVNSKNIKKIV